MTSSSAQQARALLIKHAVQQRRAIKTNICLVSAPLVFCIFLWVVQHLVVDLLLQNEKYHCGCQCLKCCGGSPYTCSALPSGYCDTSKGFKCFDSNSSSCGVQFSSADQAVWCSIDRPSSWPPVIKIPPYQSRAAPLGPKLDMPFTGLNKTASAAVASRMFPGPKFTLQQLLKLEALLKQLVNPEGTVINGYVLAQLGFQFGSTANSPSSYYVDPAFISGSLTQDPNSSNYVYVILPSPGCLEANLTTPMPVKDFLIAYLSATSPALKPLINQLVNVSLGTSATSQMMQAINFMCVDAVSARREDFAQVNRDLYCGWYKARCNGTSTVNAYTAAWDLLDTAGVQSLDVNIDYNISLPISAAPKLYRSPGILNAAVRGWARALPAKVTTKVAGAIELLGLMSFPKDETKLPFDLSSLLGPLFYTWVVQLLMPTFLQQLVYEKENRLRMMMRIHGLGDGAYWCITYLWYMLLYILYIAVFMVFGSVIRLDMFVQNSYGIQVILYLIFGNTMIAFCFVLSCFFSSSRTAEAFGYLYVLATGLIGALLVDNFMDVDAWFCGFIELVPGFALYRGLYELAAYSLYASSGQRFGLTFDKLHDPSNGTMVAWAILLGLWPVFMLLAYYLEQVVDSGSGARRHPLFFLQGCWPMKKRPAARPTAHLSPPSLSSDALGPRDRQTPSAAGGGGGGVDKGSRDFPILMHGLAKTFPKFQGGTERHAVRDMSLAVAEGECFGLLGPNGAGKTTMLNMLIGFLEPSSGLVQLDGRDISQELRRVYQAMGVCPQDNLLWGSLTAREHLFFFGRLKGLTGAALDTAVDEALLGVYLHREADKLVAKFSGGMKRRLSVAISLMGSPRVVFLDEPSTGLDPASRRRLWELVKRSKPGRGLILTTHSMEEAEVLCDRLGVFVDGQLVCLGNPREITSRYAGYLVFTITVPQVQEQQAQALVARMSPNATLTYQLSGTFKYELPSRDISLSDVFAAMHDAKEREQLQVLDWGVANATLEEVFIKLARSLDTADRDLT